MSKCLDPGGLVWCDFVEVWAPPSISQTVGIWLPVEKNQKLCCAHQAWLQVGLRLWQPFFPFEATGLTRCRLRNFCDCRRARGGHSFVHSPHSFQFKSFYRAVKWESGLPPHRHTYTHTHTDTHTLVCQSDKWDFQMFTFPCSWKTYEPLWPMRHIVDEMNHGQACCPQVHRWTCRMSPVYLSEYIFVWF